MCSKQSEVIWKYPCVSVLRSICIHEFSVVYSAAWRTYKQAGHHVLRVYLPQYLCTFLLFWVNTTGIKCSVSMLLLDGTVLWAVPVRQREGKLLLLSKHTVQSGVSPSTRQSPLKGTGPSNIFKLRLSEFSRATIPLCSSAQMQTIRLFIAIFAALCPPCLLLACGHVTWRSACSQAAGLRVLTGEHEQGLHLFRDMLPARLNSQFVNSGQKMM